MHRQSEWEEFMVCENEGIGILPWSPLKRFKIYIFAVTTSKTTLLCVIDFPIRYANEPVIQ